MTTNTERKGNKTATPMTTIAKKQLIKQAFWDKTIEVDEIYAFLNGGMTMCR